MLEIAIIKTGGKQYKVKVGQEFLVEKLLTKKGEKIEFEDILGGKKVSAKIVEETKGPKISILKFKPKARYIKRMGHRQKLTKIKIESIS